MPKHIKPKVMKTVNLGQHILREDGRVFRTDGRELRTGVSSMGLRTIVLGGRKYSLGRLMLTHFYRLPREGEVCTYRDRDRSHCGLSNLEWRPRREAVLRGMEEVNTWSEVFRAVGSRAKPVLAFRGDEHHVFDSVGEACEVFDISRSTFGRYVGKKRYYGWTFKFINQTI